MSSNITTEIVQAIKYTSLRQEVLSDNLMRLDKPGEKQKDLLPFEKLLQKNVVKLETTNNKHIHNNKNNDISFVTKFDNNELHPNQNDIDSVEVSKKINDNNAYFQALTSLYKRFTDLEETAISIMSS